MLVVIARRAALAATCLALLTACGSGNKGADRCSTSADCRSGFSCIAGDCLAPGQCPSSTTSCRTTAECPSQQECESGCCTPIQGCAHSTDCTDPLRPHCDAGTSTCKACADSTQCPLNKVCAPRGSCETACASGSDCKLATTPACYASGGVSFCAQCAVNGDCKDASAPMCLGGLCKGCTANTDCAAPTPACAPNHFCVACADGQDVDGVNPFCSGSTRACEGNTCATCNPADNRADTTNGACPGTTPVCAGSSTCVVCDVMDNHVDGTNPACGKGTPVCNAGAACVACLADKDCTTPGSYCSAAHGCLQPQLVSFPDTGAASGGTTSLIATLDHAAVQDITIGVTKLNAGDPGTLAAPGIVIAAGQSSGTVGYTAETIATGTQPRSIVATPPVANGGPRTAVVTVSALPPDLLALLGPDQTSNAQYVPAGASLQVTVEMTVPSTSDVTVTLSLQSGASGSVPSTVTIPANRISSTFSYGAGPAAAADTVTASFTSTGASLPTTKTLQINTFKVTPIVTGVSSTPLVGTGGTAALTVTLDGRPPIPVTVSLASAPANLGQVSPATVAFAAGSTTATVPAGCVTPDGCPPIFAACTPSAAVPDCFADGGARTPIATVTATVGGGTPVTVTTLHVSPSLASVALFAADGVTPIGTSAAPIPQDSLTGANFVVTLDTKAPAGDTEVFLNTFDQANISTRFKARLPNSIVVKSGKSSASLGAASSDYPYPFLPCYNGFNSTDAATLRATIPGVRASNGQKDLPNVTISKYTSTVNVICPLEPFDARRPSNTPVIFTESYTNAPVQIDVSVSPASCGTLSGTGTSTASYSTGNANTFATQFALTPTNGFTGICTVTATNHTNSQNVVTSRINFVAPAAQAKATMLLNKVEYDEAGSPDTAEYLEIYNAAGADVGLGDGTHDWMVLVISSNLAPSTTTGTTCPTDPTKCYGDNINAQLTGKREIAAFDLATAAGTGKTLQSGHRMGFVDNAVPATLPMGIDYLGSIGAITTTPAQGLLPNAPAAYLLVDPSGNIVDSLNVGGAIFGATSPHVHGSVCAPGTDTAGAPCQFDLYQGILDGWILDQPGSFSATKTPPGAGINNTLVRCKDGVSTGDQGLDWCQTGAATLGAANGVTLTTAGP